MEENKLQPVENNNNQVQQAQQNTFFDVKPLEGVDTRTTTTKIMDEVHKQAIVATVQNDEDVRNKVLKQAEKSISNELQSIDQENIKRLQQTTYDANKEACENYGINSNVPLWQIALMKGGSAFWFIIYWIFATLVICPLNVFCKGLKAFIKQSWLVVIVGVLLYLIITVGIPILVALLNKYGFDPSQWFNAAEEVAPIVEEVAPAVEEAAQAAEEAAQAAEESAPAVEAVLMRFFF